MNIKFKKTWMVAALAVSLAACSKPTDPAIVTDSKNAPDAPAAKADFPLSSKPPALTISEGTSELKPSCPPRASRPATHSPLR
jgi:PBP1b-binding outer membrane lipoprotein LpoB